MARLTAIGLMSGTSYDGVDVALLNTDGQDIGRVGPTGYRPYSEQERAVLRRAIAAAVHLGDRAERPKLLAEAGVNIEYLYTTAVEAGAMAAVIVGVPDALRASAAAGV